MSRPDDEVPVEFECAVAEDGKRYTLIISCEVSINHEAYAACLKSFAEDILNGDFSLDGGDDANEH